MPFDRAHEAMTPLIRPGHRRDMHLLLIAHGRLPCRARRPACDRCLLLSFCPYGRSVLRRA